MPPVVAAVVAIGSAVAGAIAAVASFIGTAFAAVSGFSVFGFNIGRALLQVGLSLALSSLLAPKRASVAERQASVLTMSLGETPRAVVVGQDATGGSLDNAWNDGGDFEFETLVISLSDVPVHSLVAFYVNDKRYVFTANGVQRQDGLANGGDSLWIEFRSGAPTDTIPTYISSQGVTAGEWTSGELADGFNKGCAYVVVRYKINDKVWTTGRPSFKWELKGALVYDPRKDSTVPGGSGAHRWGTPSTYEWSDNAEILRANFMWGFWNYANATTGPQLMVGPGKSFEEVPTADVIARANICDELVSLKAGGTEKRYRAGGTIYADDGWLEVEENFAAAMGGQLVERNGAIGVLPGAAQTPLPAFTDANILDGTESRYQGKLARDEMCNTVLARYPDPAQLYEETSAPIRRSLEDIVADGQPYEETLDLIFVRSGTQAQRIAEIHRRKKRLQAVAVVTLGPAYMLVEDGDWLPWQSDRRFGGATRTFEIYGVSVAQDGNTTLTLKEMASSVYAWNPAVDELDPNAPEYLPPGALPDAELSGFAVEAIVVTFEGSQIPAIKVTWTPPTDDSIKSIFIQWRRAGSTVVSSNTTSAVAAGEYIITEGLIGLAEYEVRLTPQAVPDRDAVTTAWESVTVAEASGGSSLNFSAISSANMLTFGRSLRKKVGELEALEWDDATPLQWDDETAIEWDLLGWDGHVYSAESYVGGATALGIVIYADKGLAFGLATSPEADDHYSNIDYAWLFGADGKRYIYESGVLVWDNDGDPEDVEANDVASVTYDGAFVRYFISGVMKRETAAASGLRFFFDSSFFSDAARLDGVSFASAATAGEYQETRYRRSVAPPATPTGSEPEGWSVIIPSGSDALWSITASKSQSGALITEWATPVLRSTPNWRGTYDPATVYYREDAVTFGGGSYRLIVETATGIAPSGTTQSTPQWEVLSAGGATPPVSPPAPSTLTIDVPASTTGVNLYDLAVANGYAGGNATITFEVESGTTIRGLAGSPNGGFAISTGVWPSGVTLALSLVVKNGAIVEGGGARGGRGGDCTGSGSGQGPGERGGDGGDAILCLAPITIDIQSGAIVRGGGGGGGGGNGYLRFGTPSTRVGGGGGGGGQPNGPGGSGGVATGGSFQANGATGATATTSAPGNGAGSGLGYGGRNGGAYGADGQAASNSGAPGAAGYAVRKNGNTVSVIQNGTIAGSIG